MTMINRTGTDLGMVDLRADMVRLGGENAGGAPSDCSGVSFHSDGGARRQQGAHSSTHCAHFSWLGEFVAARRKQAELIDADPAAIVGVLQCVLLVPMCAERLGAPALHPEILDLLIDFVAAGPTGTR
ncbi:hypothetical protein [Spongiactinospora sp. TRM90649]|uniref:hypothetical protein n=1 Tax=Spongiactinospora sp. TRM90649 TaxID=3031114 RepID=UPI0023F7E477|nr:hypothetical protein [Spongiactinospora sp. TRM90649]MDF5755103.1 hypothetical protein [Spongiactinospora sp. TRM90649]